MTTTYVEPDTLHRVGTERAAARPTHGGYPTVPANPAGPRAVTLHMTEVEASNLEIAALTGYRALGDETPDDVRMIVLGVLDRLGRELIEARKLSAAAAVPAEPVESLGELAHQAVAEYANNASVDQ